MTHSERLRALEAIAEQIKALRKEANTIPISAGSRRWAYMHSLESMYQSCVAAWHTAASDEESKESSVSG